MAEQIRAHPGLTLVATGPLTNIAAPFGRIPDVIPKVGRLVFMGGWASQGLPSRTFVVTPLRHVWCWSLRPHDGGL